MQRRVGRLDDGLRSFSWGLCSVWPMLTVTASARSFGLFLPRVAAAVEAHAEQQCKPHAGKRQSLGCQRLSGGRYARRRKYAAHADRKQQDRGQEFADGTGERLIQIQILEIIDFCPRPGARRHDYQLM
jgi:hypothetical protein